MILHKLFFYRSKYIYHNTNLEMSVLIKKEKCLIRVYLCIVAHKWFVYVIAAVARRDDKQRI